MDLFYAQNESTFILSMEQIHKTMKIWWSEYNMANPTSACAIHFGAAKSPMIPFWIMLSDQVKWIQNHWTLAIWSWDICKQNDDHHRVQLHGIDKLKN